MNASILTLENKPAVAYHKMHEFRIYDDNIESNIGIHMTMVL